MTHGQRRRHNNRKGTGSVECSDAVVDTGTVVGTDTAEGHAGWRHNQCRGDNDNGAQDTVDTCLLTMLESAKVFPYQND